MADVSDYPDAVRRIAAADVSPDSTTRDDVLTDLAGGSAPQIDREVAGNFADAVVTEEKVVEALEARGELPSEADVREWSGALDEYDLGERVNSVARSVSDDAVVTVEEVDRAVGEREASKRGGEPVFREEVETAVEQAGEGKQFVGSSSSDVTGEKAREVGAPRESEYRAAGASALQGRRVETDEGAAFAVESVDGETIGVYGGTTAAREAAAAETGAENLGTVGLDDVEARQEPGRTEIRLRGRTVGEVTVD
jgi:hypothetical protein